MRLICANSDLVEALAPPRLPPAQEREVPPLPLLLLLPRGGVRALPELLDQRVVADVVNVEQRLPQSGGELPAAQRLAG
eukprot:scaffold3318_cov75-Phaeocystis_antarctica.AAC.2